MVPQLKRETTVPHTQLQKTFRQDLSDDGGAWDLEPAEVEIGILIFDVEHRDMLDHLKRLYRAIAVGRGEDEIGRELTQLLAVTKRHFDHEEDYMKDLHYADTHRHTEEHRALGARLEIFVAELFVETASAAHKLKRVQAYFRAWLVGHILDHDLPLANFLIGKNIH